MGRLLLLFIVVPVVELFLLIEIGQRIGTLPTLALIVGTGVLGAWLVRLQGLGVLERVKTETAAGRMPADALIDGIIILIAGAVLMTPGVLTDAFGFVCLVPSFRRVLKGWIARRVDKAVERGSVRVSMDFGGGRSGPVHSPRVRDVTPPDTAPERAKLDSPGERD